MNKLTLTIPSHGQLITKAPDIWYLINRSVNILISNAFKDSLWKSHSFRIAIRYSAWNSQCNSQQRQSVLKELSK